MTHVQLTMMRIDSLYQEFSLFSDRESVVESEMDSFSSSVPDCPLAADAAASLFLEASRYCRG